MNNELNVSVIIPVYNSRDYILEALSSVQSQEIGNIEILVVDDCSTDESYKMILKESFKDKRISVFKTKENSGAGVARNIGLENAKGRFIAFLDADDVWKTGKLKKQLDVMSREGAAISHTSFDFIDGNGGERGGFVSASPVVDLERNLKFTEIGTSTALLDRSKVGSFRFSTMRNRQDLALWIDLLGKGFVSVGLSEALVSYRVRKNQISSNKVKMLMKTYPLYWNIEKLNFFKRNYYFLYYVINAIYKRLRRK